MKLEFLLFKFHDANNGLIGNNILRQLFAVINLKENFLEIGDKRIPI